MGTFPKDFSQRATSHGYFPQQQLLKSILATALGPLAHHSRCALSQLQLAAPQRALTNLWEAAVLEIAHFGNCTFGKLPLGKLSLGKSPLGKCLREIT